MMIVNVNTLCVGVNVSAWSLNRCFNGLNRTHASCIQRARIAPKLSLALGSTKAPAESKVFELANSLFIHRRVARDVLSCLLRLIIQSVATENREKAFPMAETIVTGRTSFASAACRPTHRVLDSMGTAMGHCNDHAWSEIWRARSGAGSRTPQDYRANELST